VLDEDSLHTRRTTYQDRQASLNREVSSSNSPGRCECLLAKIAFVKTTAYFEAMRRRPDRTRIRDEWGETVHNAFFDRRFMP